MSKQIVSTASAPSAIGPYSQAVKANGFVFVSGQLPLDPKTGKFSSMEVSAQTERSILNLEAVLAAAGSGLDRVVKTTVFLKNMYDFNAMNEVYSRYFKSDCPARAAVEVARLPKDALVEIECVALAD